MFLRLVIGSTLILGLLSVGAQARIADDSELVRTDKIEYFQHSSLDENILVGLEQYKVDDTALQQTAGYVSCVLRTYHRDGGVVGQISGVSCALDEVAHFFGWY